MQRSHSVSRKSRWTPEPWELVNKTNQFNLNGRRYTESAWQAFLRDSETFLMVAAYKDKYGPLGKIAVLGGRCQGAAAFLDAWVMSCRAFTRRVEHRCLQVLFDRFGAEEVVLDFKPTVADWPCRSFWVSFRRSPTVSRPGSLESRFGNNARHYFTR